MTDINKQLNIWKTKLQEIYTKKIEAKELKDVLFLQDNLKNINEKCSWIWTSTAVRMKQKWFKDMYWYTAKNSSELVNIFEKEILPNIDINKKYFYLHIWLNDVYKVNWEIKIRNNFQENIETILDNLIKIWITPVLPIFFEDARWPNRTNFLNNKIIEIYNMTKYRWKILLLNYNKTYWDINITKDDFEIHNWEYTTHMKYDSIDKFFYILDLITEKDKFKKNFNKIKNR